jgi:hypothetical protein
VSPASGGLVVLGPKRASFGDPDPFLDANEPKKRIAQEHEGSRRGMVRRRKHISSPLRPQFRAWRDRWHIDADLIALSMLTPAASDWFGVAGDRTVACWGDNGSTAGKAPARFQPEAHRGDRAATSSRPRPSREIRSHRCGSGGHLCALVHLHRLCRGLGGTDIRQRPRRTALVQVIGLAGSLRPSRRRICRRRQGAHRAAPMTAPACLVPAGTTGDGAHDGERDSRRCQRLPPWSTSPWAYIAAPGVPDGLVGNSHGQLGDGTAIPARSPCGRRLCATAIEGVFITIACGSTAQFGLLGLGDMGQIGDGAKGDPEPAAPVFSALMGIPPA